jgi:hypothetical protein
LTAAVLTRTEFDLLQAGTLLYFIFGEAPHLELEPKVDLASQERRRLQQYMAAIAARYTAVKTVYFAGQHSGAADFRNHPELVTRA